MTTTRPQGRTIRLDRVSRDLQQSWKRAIIEIAKTVRLAGDGPAEASLSIGLERQPFKWDVNGLYRSLGLTPEATRVQIAHAYLDLDGYRSSRLTLCAEVLLNKETRRAYDAIPIGSWWGADPDLLRERERLYGHGEDTFLNPWGVYLDCMDDSVVDVVDTLWWSVVASAVRGILAAPSVSVGVHHGDEFSAKSIGSRVVVFLPLRLAPSPGEEYGARIASAIRLLNPTESR